MNDSAKPTKAKSPNRHQARGSAIECLYAWDSSAQDGGMLPQLITDRLEEEDRESQDETYLRELVYGVTESVSSLDEHIGKVVRGRSLRSVARVEINVIRLALWEMQNRLEIPYRVIINEALQLTREYADENARGFVNGVLDKLAKEFRSVEISAGN